MKRLKKVRNVRGFRLLWGLDRKPIEVGETVECSIPELTEALLRRGFEEAAEPKRRTTKKEMKGE